MSSSLELGSSDVLQLGLGLRHPPVVGLRPRVFQCPPTGARATSSSPPMSEGIDVGGTGRRSPSHTGGHLRTGGRSRSPCGGHWRTGGCNPTSSWRTGGRSPSPNWRTSCFGYGYVPQSSDVLLHGLRCRAMSSCPLRLRVGQRPPVLRCPPAFFYFIFR